MAREATIDALYRVEGNAEIIRGEIVLMSPTGVLPSFAAGEIFVSLREYSRRTKTGYAFSDGAVFLVDLPYRWSLSPDAAFATVREWSGKFYDGAPVFALEVRSCGDYGLAAERALAAKRAEYFAAGTLVVWDVDVLRDHVVRVYRAENPPSPSVYGRRDAAEAEPALPGWSMRVDDLFPTP